YLRGESAGDLFGLRKESTSRHVANAPEHLASVKGAVPLFARGLTAASRITFEGPRWDRNEFASDPAQKTTDSAVIWDIVISGKPERWGRSYSFGAYNLGDYRYSVPVSGEFTQRQIVQNGRTFLATADVAF